MYNQKNNNKKNTGHMQKLATCGEDAEVEWKLTEVEQLDNRKY